MVGQIWIALLPLVAHAVIALPSAWALVFSAGVAGAFGGAFWLMVGWQAGLQAGLSYLAGVAFVGLFTQLTLEAQRTKEQVEKLAADLQAANAKLREYAAQIEELAIAKERNRLAREIHDSLGHYLTVVNVQLEAAQAVLDTDAARARGALVKAQSLTQEGLKDVRRSVAALRASPTENRPLPQALQALADETRAAGVVTAFNVTGTPRALPAPVELALYRAAQEALTNIRKHARASHAEVHLSFDADRIGLRVQDNGVGAASTEGGFGLVGVRERVQLLDGDVHLDTTPGAGFRLEVSVPA
jgi:signal transduction histidine kinase